MKAKRIVMAVTVLVLVLAMACALVSCDFGNNQHNVNLNSNDASFGSVQGDGEYKEGEHVTIIATEYDGYIFAGWYDGDTLISTDSFYSFVMGDKDVAYTAKFDICSYAVELECDETHGSVTGGGNYEYGSSVTITATANTGYSFVGWYIGDILLTSDNAYSFVMRDRDASYTAKFDICSYAVELECDKAQGNVTGGGDYDYGSNVTITATAKTGYSFAGWYLGDELISDKAEYTITNIAQNVTYTAMFSTNKYDVTVECNEAQGSVTGGGDFAYGSSVAITAVAKEGYSFVGWYKGNTKVSDKDVWTFDMDNESVSYTAKFSANSYMVQVACEFEHGTVNGDGEYAYGGSVTITATEKPGYIFEAWYDGNKEISKQSHYTFDMVARNVIYTAKFSIDLNFEKLNLMQLENGTYKIIGVKDKSIKKIDIPNCVSIIGVSAFENCSSLTSITIPNSVASIGSSAFYECYALAEIYNLSNLNITKGSTEYGRVAYYAYDVYTSLSESSKLTDIDGAILHTDGDNVTLVRYIGDTSSATIPNSVTRIGEHAFDDCSSLTNVTIPNSVTSISGSAFRGCRSLTSITIPFVGAELGGTENTHFGYIFGASKYSENAKYVTNSLKEVIITGGESIGYRAFEGCSSLTSVTIGDGVTSIGEYAFRDCSNLTSVTIGNSVTSIDNQAFSDCFALAEVYNLSSLNITKGSTEYGRVAYYAYDVYTSLSESSKLTDIDGAILHTDGDNVTMVRYIGDTSSVTIPDSATSIGEHAFDDCSSLTSITIPDSVTNIGEYAFYYCSSLTSLTIPDSITSIGQSTFEGCSSLTSITIPNSVTSIGEYAFGNCSSLTRVTMPDSVTSIGADAFIDCRSLTSITIPDNVSSIGVWAFKDCIKLTSVTIGKSVKSIGKEAFSGCHALAEVYNLSSLKITKESTDNGYVGYYALDVYTVTSDSSKLTSKDGMILRTYRDKITLVKYNRSDANVVIPKYISIIGSGAFIGCNNLTSVTIPDSVTSIGDYAFKGCRGLTRVTIDDGITSIGNYAFSGCSNLQSVDIGDSVTSIGNYAFSDCQRFTSMNIPNSVTSIGDYAFSGCSGLNSITLSTQQWYNSKLKSIGSYAFRGCTYLTSVSIPYSVTSIGSNAFENCSRLTKIDLPRVTSIGDYMFSGCSSLTNINIPSYVTSIGDRAFYNCSGLANITIPDSVTSIGFSAFYNCSSLTSVKFENTSGWFVSQSSNATSGTSVDVTDLWQNASNLRWDYCYRYWKRK